MLFPVFFCALCHEEVGITGLIEASANLNAEDAKGQTALIRAAQPNKDNETIRALAAAGADVTVKSNEGKAALDYIEGNEALKDTDVSWALSDACWSLRRE